MRIAFLAAALTLAGAATASPLAPVTADAAATAAQTVHHKPGHQGGPPWLRDRQGGRDRDFYERRAYDRGGYDAYESRRVSRCVTRYEERYDPYRDAYVRRPVQVCR